MSHSADSSPIMSTTGVNFTRNFFGSLLRRKTVVNSAAHGPSGSTSPQLAKALSVLDITAIGIGTTIGAGIYILVGTVARECSGPALGFSFLLAALAAGLSAVCYAELASRFPSAGSAYHYSYICSGEAVAWLVGWALMLEYTIGGSAIARGISPNLALLFGGENNLPFFLAHHHISWLDTVVDPCSSILICVITGMLCLGIKESARIQAIVTSVNICALAFVIVVGGYLGWKAGWPGYELPSGLFPLGINGMFAGSATVFFAYIGFDCIASTAEEVKNPQRDLPLGITLALSICCALYMLVSVVIVGLVPYYDLDPNTPISSAFASHGLDWAMYIITAGAVTALCASLMGSFLPQPRVLMVMARDGLLPSFFSDVSKRTQVPVKGTIITGAVAAIFSFFMDVSQLAGMVSAGTLLSFTMVAISVLILRYVHPEEVPLEGSSSAFSSQFDGIVAKNHYQDGSSADIYTFQGGKEDNAILQPLVARPNVGRDNSEKRQKVAGQTIVLTCVGIFLFTISASSMTLPTIPQFTLCATGGALLLYGLISLSYMDQDDSRQRLGLRKGFICPCVPMLPVASILINVYLMVNLGAGTWIRVLLWLTIGMVVYFSYGQTHSLLNSNRLKDVDRRPV